MRISIDACCWSNRRGFGRFTRELLAELVPLAASKGHEVVLLVDRPTLDGSNGEDGEQRETMPAAARVVAVETRTQQTSAAAANGSRPLGDMRRMSRMLRRTRPDVVFFPAVYTFYPAPIGTPTIVTLHDAIAEQLPDLIFPNWRSRTLWALKMRLALLQATRILTVSESAKRQVMEAFRVPERRIDVTTEGPSRDFFAVPDEIAIRNALDSHGIPAASRIILYVGGISPHKNLDGLVRAAFRLRDRPAWRLVLVGDYSGDSFHTCHQPLTALIRELGLSERVTFTGHVSNESLRSLYHAASVLVLPSFSEGFGLPVVEAMACGTPVAVSKAGSLPEIVGDAGLMFDPRQPAEIADAIAVLLDDPAEADRRRRTGIERAKLYTWRESARRVLAALERAAGA
jgi:glycosyltransferase involved in cell wall biosynthesis